MKLKLNNQQKLIQCKSRSITLELYDGLSVEYYMNDFSRIENPVLGTIKGECNFRIVWDDGTEDALIDNSKFTNDILDCCGFQNKIF